ncbi:hypothetical protein PCASD_14925 [Puccinia coronata f. sp. avenae]|uniref:Uncharacterized protein n=1 Tax=Puccinia coronata f. sp. avenae TaxID=200324 RepID=A0A2N5TF14_9BASI|nr:hypothetical protein PCASD_14925 [Puccinia coronata f. sp. avenae]
MSEDFFGANGFLPRSLGRPREEQSSPAPKLSEYGLGPPGQRSGAAKNLAPRTLQPPAALRQLNMIGQTRLNGQHALWLDSACTC